jgi:hypothetical protein
MELAAPLLSEREWLHASTPGHRVEPGSAEPAAGPIVSSQLFESWVISDAGERWAGWLDSPAPRQHSDARCGSFRS